MLSKKKCVLTIVLYITVLLIDLALCENVWSIVAHFCRSSSRFLKHEVIRIIVTHPDQDASPSQVTPQHFVRFP